MDILKNKQECCGCYACYNVCPVQAIEMRPDTEGFYYPVIQEEKCIHCKKCLKVCPIINNPKIQPLKDVYGCKALSKEERISSASGGIFSVLAREIILEKGVICGAAFNEKQVVCHLVTDNEQGLLKIKGTKYVQSQIGDSYRQVKNYLEYGKKVLFSGTPCQIAGLKNYLGKEYENLLCVDLICHGVPSPSVFKRFLKEVSKDYTVTNVNFRNKLNGMSHSTIDIEINNEKIIKEKYNECPYTIGFVQNLYTRPSCYKCHFKGEKRSSDITIGDFWSVKEFHPEFYDDYGISSVIIHSAIGKQWFNRVVEKLDIVHSTIEEVSCWNECLTDSVSWNENRTEFYNIWNDKSFEDTVKLLKTDVKITRKKGLLKYMEGKIRKWLA